METYIVLVPVNHANSSNVCMSIANQKFYHKVSIEKLVKSLLKTNDISDVLILTQNDLTMKINFEEINMSDYFIAFCKLRDLEAKQQKKIEKAKKFLKKCGYAVGDLHNIDEVQHQYECTDAKAHEILALALENEETRNQISFAIDEFAMLENLELKNKC